jgi:hypothetical protein
MMPSAFPHKTRSKRIKPDADFNWFIARKNTETSFQKLVCGKILWAGELRFEHTQRLHSSEHKPAHFISQRVMTKNIPLVIYAC